VLVSSRPAGQDLIRVMIYVDRRGVEFSRNDIAINDGGSCLR